MRTRLISTAAALAACFLFLAEPAGAALTPPVVPASIAVPPGNVLYLVGHAKGYQVYRCTLQDGAFVWVLAYPFATLYNDANQAVATHYAGPSWTGADSSTVVGTRTGSALAPGGNAILWLRLAAASTTGPPGGTFTNTTFIQRINTTGGLAPAAGCDAGHVGALTAVFYTADYYFYRAG